MKNSNIMYVVLDIKLNLFRNNLRYYIYEKSFFTTYRFKHKKDIRLFPITF